MEEMVQTDEQSAITGGHYGSTAGGHGYGSIAGHKAYAIVPVWWLEGSQSLADGELKW